MRPYISRLGTYVCSPRAFEIWREITSEWAGGLGRCTSPITRCTWDVARCSCRRGESACRQCAASDEKTIERKWRRPHSTTLYTWIVGGSRSTTTSLSVLIAAPDAARAATPPTPRDAMPLPAAAAACDVTAAARERCSADSAPDGRRTAYSNATAASETSPAGRKRERPARWLAPDASMACCTHRSRAASADGYARWPAGSGGVRVSGDQRCRSCRSPTRRSQRRLEVAETWTDWMGLLLPPKAAMKDGWEAISRGRGVRACRRSENSPSCRLTSTSAPWVVVTCRSHASSLSAASAPGTACAAATARAVRARTTERSSFPSSFSFAAFAFDSLTRALISLAASSARASSLAHTVDVSGTYRPSPR